MELWDQLVPPAQDVLALVGLRTLPLSRLFAMSKWDNSQVYTGIKVLERNGLLVKDYTPLLRLSEAGIKLYNEKIGRPVFNLSPF